MAGFLKGVFSGLALVAVAFVATTYLVPQPPGEMPVEPGESEVEAVGDPASEASASEEMPPLPAEPAPASEAPEATPEDDGTEPGPESGVLQAPDAPIAPVVEDAGADASDADPVQDAAPEPAGSELPELASDSQEASPVPDAGTEDVREAEALAAERGGVDIGELPLPDEGALGGDIEIGDGGVAMPAQDMAAEEPEAPAWRRHAAAFEAAGEGPLYAVIAIDAPADPEAEARIMRMTAAVTVALDPADPDAPRRAEGYRSAGHEVAILAGGEMSSAALSAQIDALPEAVAWVAPMAGGWPEGAAGQELAAALDASGLALVLWDEGPEPRPEAVPVARMLAAEMAVRGRDGALDLLDRAAEAAGGAEVVAVPGRAAHPAFLPAVMQRAGRASEAPGEPAPLSAALAAAGE